MTCEEEVFPIMIEPIGNEPIASRTCSGFEAIMIKPIVIEPILNFREQKRMTDGVHSSVRKLWKHRSG